VQRIRLHEIDARIEGRALRDGEVVTACQAACPADAIVFGSIADPSSQVSALHALPQSYMVLQEELGTLPRTRYLAHLRNRNEEAAARLDGVPLGGEPMGFKSDARPEGAVPAPVGAGPSRPDPDAPLDAAAAHLSEESR
jgi:hypothetical protein